MNLTEQQTIDLAQHKEYVLTDELLGKRLNWRRAYLRGADLSGAYLRGADLCEADLCEADLSGANLLNIKQDVWAVLDQNPHEVAFLLLALQEGRVDGSSYDNECACLFGTIAHAKRVDYLTLSGIDLNRPCERWFLAILKTKPSEHPVTAITEEWILEWQAKQ